MKKSGKHTVFWRVLGGVAAFIIIVLVVLHFYLATWAVNYVNNVLQHIDGYTGSVQNISIDLYRGAYRMDKLVLNKKEGTIPTPFVSVEQADFSVQWRALLHGRIVADVSLVRPVINFAVNGNAEQTGANVDWTVPIKQLSPIDINHVTFKEGKISYQDFSSTPQVNIYINDMHGEVGNLRNVVNPSEPLPSTVDIEGDSIGGGALKITGRMNILKTVPDMNLATQLENVHLPALNNYSDAYGAFSFKDGDFDLYSQLGVKDQQVTGYVKLLARHASVDIQKTENPLQAAWATVVAGVITVFTNPTKDQFATRADLQGDLSNINADIWSALGSIIRNAFISALQRGLDSTGNDGVIQQPAK